jgi:hypothetical protein
VEESKSAKVEEVRYEPSMLRRRARAEVLAAIFFEAGRDCACRDERDAGIFATGGGYCDAEQEAAYGAVSAR